MTVKNIVEAVASTHGLSKAKTRRIFDQIFALIKENITDTSFKVPSFGTFKKVYRNARVGRNPRTGESIDIPARTVVRFKASKTRYSQPEPITVT